MLVDFRFISFYFKVDSTNTNASRPRRKGSASEMYSLLKSFRVITSKKITLVLIAIGLLTLFIYSYNTQKDVRNYGNEGQLTASTPWKKDPREGESSSVSYVVNTPTCRIPEMDPMDKSIQGFLEPDGEFPRKCSEAHNRSWAYVDGTTLVINKTAVVAAGYSTSSLHCCYRIIERVEQPFSGYDMNADNYVRYSQKCHKIPNGKVEIDREFIRVHCISKSLPLLHDVVYRDFFAIPMSQSHNDRLVQRKLLEWQRKSQLNQRRPPNVVIIGIDNISRMNSYRHLKETLKLLREIGAVELKGHTKVGENTFPNTIPFASGYTVEDLGPICYKSNEDPLDNCPFVWKAFDDVGYITVHAEDAPYLGGFNYLKTGFVSKPTDFYLRTLMLAVMQFMPRSDYFHTDCIGRYMTEEFVFNYILDIIHLSNSSSAPVFVHSWLTSLAHHNYNNVKFGDASIAHFIRRLVKESDDNSIFFFMSDHGQRFGPIRETPQGWYEDKLPVHWVYIPQQLRERFPSWHSSLETNSARLTSHFDVYKTILTILKTFDNENRATNVYRTSASQPGQSLFEPVPENRTCNDAGIKVNLCACTQPEPLDITEKLVVKAAKTAVKHLAGLVPTDVCAEPKLEKIVSAAYLKVPSGSLVYLINLLTSPGDFLFEVTLELQADNQTFAITTELLRMNKITRPATCVKTPLIERYCYCK